LQLPFRIGDKDIIALRDLSICKGLAPRSLSAEIVAKFTIERLELSAERAIPEFG
jgi:hypothetical protein